MSVVVTTNDKGIYRITMNRPKQLNALNRDLLNGLMAAIGEAGSDASVRCVVLCGAGNHFMAGGDIGYFYTLRDQDSETKSKEYESLISEVHVLVEKMAELPVPIIASVRGAAAGFGISLVAGCDLAVASDTSFYTSAYNLLGTSPDGGSTYYIPRSVGIKKAMEIALLTKRYNSQQALEMGLINKVVDDNELEDATSEIAGTIVKSARESVTNTKHLIRQSLNTDLNKQLKSELDCFLECALTADFTEGVTAFVEKRKPNFAD